MKSAKLHHQTSISRIQDTKEVCEEYGTTSKKEEIGILFIHMYFLNAILQLNLYLM
jgi:hypothetical protein